MIDITLGLVLLASSILNLSLVLRSREYSCKPSRVYAISAFYTAGVLLMSSSLFVAIGGSKSVAFVMLVLYIAIRTAQDMHSVSVYESRRRLTE